MVVPILKKKGRKKDCISYRGVSLLSHTGKMYTKIFKQWTGYRVNPYLSDAKLGFRKGRGCTYVIFVLQQLSEKANRYNKEFHIFFIDQDKSFD